MWVIDVRPGPRILLMSAEIKALLPFRIIGYVEICVLKKAMNKWAKPKIRNKEKQKEKKNKRKRKRKNNFRAKNIITEFLKNKSEIKSPKSYFLDNHKSGKLSEHLFKGEMATEPKEKNNTVTSLDRDCHRRLLSRFSWFLTNVLSWEAWGGEHSLWELIKPTGSALMTWTVHWQEAQANAVAPSPPLCVGRRDLPSRRNKGRTWDLLGVRPLEWWAIRFCSTTPSDYSWS